MMNGRLCTAVSVVLLSACGPAIVASGSGRVVRPVTPLVEADSFPDGKPMVLATTGQVRLGVSWDAICERDSLSTPTLQRTACFQQTFAVHIACRGVPCKVNGTKKSRSEVHGETDVVVSPKQPGTLWLVVTLVRLNDRKRQEFKIGPIEVVAVDQLALECVTTNNPDVVFGLRVNARSRGRPVFGVAPAFVVDGRPTNCRFVPGMVDERGSEFVCRRSKHRWFCVLRQPGREPDNGGEEQDRSSTWGPGGL